MNDAKDVGFAITFGIDYGAGRTTQVVFGMPTQTKLADLNETLDLIRTATNRQQAHYLIPILEAEIAKNKRQLDAMKRDVARIDERNKGKPQLKTTDQQARENVMVSTEQLQARIEEMENDLAKTRKEAE